jgi:hypothetical protein
MKDVYDQEIEYLTNNPNRIYTHWNQSSPLFARAREESFRAQWFGCLTQIRTDTYFKAQTYKLTELIRADERIPLSPKMVDENGDLIPDNGGMTIQVEHLAVFAEWQRRLDQELCRRPPILDIAHLETC